MTQGPPPGWYPPPSYPPPSNQPPSNQPPPYAQSPKPPRAPQSANGLAIAAVVLGGIGLAVSWVPFVGLGLPVVALALGATGLGRANVTGAGRGPALAGIVLGAIGLVVAVAVSTLFLFLWPRISPCLDSRLGPHEQAQCLRDHLGLPQPTPSPTPDGLQFSVRSAGSPGLLPSGLRPADRS